ncbi:hypothetical protein Mx9_p84 [Myxococcus phage Mx9]|nr:hypothetical protein Mx9_p84 [Myxococcus phage Mx9]
MRVTFRKGERTKSDGRVEEVEFVDIHTGRDGKDVVSRPAKDEDRVRFSAEYEAFNPPPAPAEPEPVVEAQPVVAEPEAKSKKRKG